MKIVVTGATGLLGSHLCMLYPDIIGLTKHDCDITNPEQVYDILNTLQPHVVINAAGIVPKHPDNNTMDQFRVNGIAPRILAAACSMRKMVRQSYFPLNTIIGVYFHILVHGHLQIRRLARENRCNRRHRFARISSVYVVS